MGAVRVGVIGAGAMGTTHVHAIAAAVSGAEVAAVADVDEQRARAAAQLGGESAAVYADGHALIADPRVDAVLVASIAATHEELVVACLAAGKPVLCEKPLATGAEAARRIVQAEAARGERLVQVGFMRRFDPGYRELKRLIDAGEIGAPLLAHCAHRNADAPASFDSAVALTDSVVHEIDIVRWLFGEEIVGVTVLAGRASRHAPEGVNDPQIVLLETAGAVLVDVESFVRAQYGYDIRCEVVGETGTLALPTPSVVPPGFEVRFADAYRDELQAWVDGVAAGRPATGPTAWDGYAAGVVAGAAVESLAAGRRVEVELDARPALYA
jgi:myo-inositol 2-dehydrogenase/D-chiro-inositol 1-dehydrogenase